MAGHCKTRSKPFKDASSMEQTSIYALADAANPSWRRFMPGPAPVMGNHLVSGVRLMYSLMKATKFGIGTLEKLDGPVAFFNAHKTRQ